MQTSTTSSESAYGLREGTLGLVGSTPLLSLGRSGEGRVFVKHEGYNPGGSFFDRVVLRALSSSPSDLVVDGGGALAVSAAAVAAGRASVRVIGSGDRLGRVRKLIGSYGARVDELEGAAATAAFTDAVAAGSLPIQSDDHAAVLACLAEVAEEVNRAGICPEVWVLPDFGAEPERVRAALTIAGTEPFLELVAYDREERRSLSGSAACRRAQMGHREGMLLSPLGAEIAEAAIQIASEVTGAVVALLPEGGHRYLGWW